MKRRFLCRALILALGFSAFSLPARSWQEIEASGLRVVTEDNYQPFNFMNGNKPDGFVADFLALLREEAPFEIHQDIIPWTGLLAGIATDRYDVGLTGTLITAERLKHLDFTAPIANAQHYAIVRARDKDKFDSVASLSGKTVGVQAGSVLAARLPELEEMLEAEGGKLGRVVEYTSYPEALSDLVAGRVDFVVDNFISARALEEKRGNVFAVSVPVSGPSFVAFPLQKGNDDLNDYLTGFIGRLRESGALYRLQEKWFGVAFEELPVAPIRDGASLEAMYEALGD